MLRRLAENRDAHSLAANLRRKRFAFFRTLLQDLPRPIRILDVGGTQRFWEVIGTPLVADDLQVTLLNLAREPVTLPRFRSVAGDARDMASFRDRQFDIAFSNSVIEHLRTFMDQRRMAEEVRRVAARYFVQTPNFFFLLEPHFLFPGFHFLPVATRTWLLSHFDLGWYKRIPDPVAARREVEAIRLLSKSELRQLFPGAKIFTEKFFGLSKSFVAYNGFS